MLVLVAFGAFLAFAVVLAVAPEGFWQSFERFRCRLYGHCPCPECVNADVCASCGASPR